MYVELSRDNPGGGVVGNIISLGEIVESWSEEDEEHQEARRPVVSHWRRRRGAFTVCGREECSPVTKSSEKDEVMD